MAGKNNKRNRKKNSVGSNAKNISARTVVPKYDKHQRFTKMPDNNSSLKYGTILVIAALAGVAATFSSIGNAIIDDFGLKGVPASGIWWTLVAIALIVGFMLTLLDWSSRGKI